MGTIGMTSIHGQHDFLLKAISSELQTADLTALHRSEQNGNIPDAAKSGFKIFLGQGTLIPFIELLSISIKTVCKHRGRI